MVTALLELLLVVLLAPFIGSFLSVLVVRLPEGKAVVISRSVCVSCGQQLRPADLIPVFSWLRLRGRCRHCGGSIGLLYPAMELGAVFVAIWAATVTGGWILLASCVLGWTLLCLAFVDWRRYLLPDALTAFLCLTGLIVAYLIEPSRLFPHAIGAAGGFLFFASVGWIYRRLRDRDGLGFGDAKLLAGLGAWTSWIGLPSILLIASVLALLFALMRGLARSRLTISDRLPFGPFLALAGWLVWLYGPLTIG